MLNKKDAEDAKDTGLTPGSGKSPGVGNGNLFQDSCQENPMDRRDCQVTVHSVAKTTKQQIIRNNTDTKNVSLLRINLNVNAETLVNL